MKKIMLALLMSAPMSVFSATNYAMPEPAKKQEVAAQSTIKDLRPAPEKRLFRSEAVEKQILDLKSKLTAINPKLYWMFVNCFPNTLDTTVWYSNESGDDDTFVITGDIEAMWLRDSAAQVWPYLRYVNKDEPLRHLIRGVIRRQHIDIGDFYRFFSADVFQQIFQVHIYHLPCCY